MAPVVNLDPVLFSLGPLQVRWYGLMYVVAYIIGGQILKYLAKKNFFKIAPDKAESLVTYLLIGMFLGARTFYVFFYNWEYYSQHLDELLSVWHGGLSFHGAVVGMTAACAVFARKHKLPFLMVTDSLALAGTQGLFWGRLGNFINGELFGRVTDSWIGLVFPSGGPSPRHPSQLYEAIGEGIILTLILLFVKKRAKVYGALSAVFVGGYAIIRFFIEFFREPDAQLGFLWSGLTMGQILCASMLIFASLFYYFSKKKNIAIV